MNKTLVKFETSKLGKSTRIVFLLSFLTQIVFLIFFALVGQFDVSSSDEVLKNLVGIGSISSTITLSVLSIYGAVLMNHSIVKNYIGEARIRLYSLPNGRSVLFKAKIYAFVNRVLYSQFAGLLLANFLFWIGVSLGLFKGIDSNGLNSTLLLLLLTAVTTLVTLSIVLISVVVGIHFSSTQITLISVLLMIVCLGNVVAQLLSSALILTSSMVVFLTFVSLAVINIWASKIEKEEVL